MADAPQGQATKSLQAPRPERFFKILFRFFEWLDRFRQVHPIWTKLLVHTPISGLLVWILTVHFPSLSGKTTAWQLASWVTKLVIGVIVSEGFLRGVVPILRYSWQATSMRQLGLHQVVNDRRAFCKVLSKLVSEQDPNERIRVICISGKYLFVEPKTRGGENTPLYDHCKRGVLDVLMPVSKATNVTIASRWNTYADEEFKKDNGYHDIGAFLAEIDAGKARLDINKENNLFEHDILCLWRVVLLKKYCVVQTYFPNKRGAGSNEAPIFIYEKGADSNTGYYATFEKMFELVPKNRPGKAAQPPGPGSTIRQGNLGI